jgi:hypothetical protein
MVLVFGFLLSRPGAAQQQAPRHRPVFASREAVEMDAARRLSRQPSYLKAQGPTSSNTVTYEGNVAQNFLSGTYGAVLVDLGLFRFECDNGAYTLGCAYVSPGDHVLIYGHLRTYLSCRHDATDDEVVVNLIYKRVTVPCGDLICTTWTLLTQ